MKRVHSVLYFICMSKTFHFIFLKHSALVWTCNVWKCTCLKQRISAPFGDAGRNNFCPCMKLLDCCVCYISTSKPKTKNAYFSSHFWQGISPCQLTLLIILAHKFLPSEYEQKLHPYICTALCRPGFTPVFSLQHLCFAVNGFLHHKGERLKIPCPDEQGPSQLDFFAIFHHFQSKSVQLKYDSGYYQNQAQSNAVEWKSGYQWLLQ